MKPVGDAGPVAGRYRLERTVPGDADISLFISDLTPSDRSSALIINQIRKERRPRMNSFETLFEPITIGTMEVKNRFVMAPMVTNYAAGDGSVTDRFKAYHKTRAKGGVGLIIVEATFVHPRGKGFAHELGIDKDALIGKLTELTDAVHEHGAKMAVQLYHSGRQSYSAVTGGRALRTVAPCLPRMRGNTAGNDDAEY